MSIIVFAAFGCLLCLVMPVSADDGTATLADSKAPLADAAKQQDLSGVRDMLAHGVAVDAPRSDGMTALHWAVYHDNQEMVELLLAAGANANALTRYSVPPLALACQNGNTAVVMRLLRAGADPHASLRGGETMLMLASRTGQLGPVQALIERGADVNATERSSQTALMWAAAEGHVEVAEALLTAGADFRKSLKSGFNAWFFAVRQGQTSVARRLLEAGADVNAVMLPADSARKRPLSGLSALILAIENGHFDLAVELLDAGADANDLRCGYAGLHALTWVRKPLRGDGDPPPLASGTLSSLGLVRALVAHGADVNIRYGKTSATGGRLNLSGATPFLMAAETGDIPLMQLLLELGADPQIGNADQCSPLLAAAGVGVLGDGDDSAGTEEDAIQAIELLLSQGADINAVDQHGNTAMHGAAYRSWNQLAHFLADHGAQINVWNRPNQFATTPLRIAQGHRPGNFRPSPETIAVIERIMLAAGVDIEP